ncbi:MAG: hypothetical protein ACLQAR_08955 [Steroidobacteraceae bacterium]
MAARAAFQEQVVLSELIRQLVDFERVAQAPDFAKGEGVASTQYQRQPITV